MGDGYTPDVTLDDRTSERGAEPDLEAHLHEGAAYGSHYYSHYTVPYEKNEHWIEFFDQIAEHIVAELAPRTSLDAGCAIGMLVESLHQRGVDARGIDVSEWAIEHAVDGARGRNVVGSLTDPLPDRVDLITCIEVIEHIPESQVRGVVANLCRATDQILLSSVPYEFAEATHVNVRPAEYWAALFAQHGFFRDLDYDASYVAPWAALFHRRDDGVVEAVRRYERASVRLREEVRQLRLAAVEHQAQLQEAHDHGQRDEIRQLQEQLLTERDLTASAEAEAGDALGKLRVAETEIFRYQVVARDFARLAQLPFWPSLARYLKLQSASRGKVAAVLRRLGARE